MTTGRHRATNSATFGAIGSLDRVSEQVQLLDPELRPYVDATPIGMALRHPLVFQVPVLSAQIANDVFLAKRDMLSRALATRNWTLFLQLHERAFRLDALVSLRTGTTAEQLSGFAFSQMARSVWIDSESIGYNQDAWLALFTEHIDAVAFMGPDDTAALAAMPLDAEGCLQIFRGCDPDALDGMSWTTDYDLAYRFAHRRRSEPVLLTGRVARSDVLAYTDARSEAEVIVRPETVRDVEATEL